LDQSNTQGWPQKTRPTLGFAKQPLQGSDAAGFLTKKTGRRLPIVNLICFQVFECA
jgi:hypothetical protein